MAVAVLVAVPSGSTANITSPSASNSATTDYVLTNAELVGANVIPWGQVGQNGQHGDPDYLANNTAGGNNVVKAVNMGQVRAFVPLFATGTNSQLCFVYTSSEYFAPSAWLCMKGANDRRLSIAT